MSTGASIALLILAVELILVLLAVFIGAIVAGIGIVESTGVLRRSLRRQAKRVRGLEARVTETVEKKLLVRLAKAERAIAWTARFVRSVSEQDRS